MGSFIQYGGVVDHALVIRGIATVYNTDYITDITLRLNGAIEACPLSTNPSVPPPEGRAGTGSRCVPELGASRCPDLRPQAAGSAAEWCTHASCNIFHACFWTNSCLLAAQHTAAASV